MTVVVVVVVIMRTIFWYSFPQNGDTFYSKTGYILNWFMITMYLNSVLFKYKALEVKSKYTRCTDFIIDKLNYNIKRR
jgi:hypothetical protein